MKYGRYYEDGYSRELQQDINRICGYYDWWNKYTMFKDYYDRTEYTYTVTESHTSGIVEREVVVPPAFESVDGWPPVGQGASSATQRQSARSVGNQQPKATNPTPTSTSTPTGLERPSNFVDSYDQGNLLGDLSSGLSGIGSVWGFASKRADGMGIMGKLGKGFSIGFGAVSLINNTYLSYVTDGHLSAGEISRGIVGAGCLLAQNSKYPVAMGIGYAVGIVDMFGGWNDYYRQIDKIQFGAQNGLLYLPASALGVPIIPWCGGVSDVGIRISFQPFSAKLIR